MPSDEGARLLARIGELLAHDTAYPLDGTLLFAVLDTQFVAPSIFKDRGNHILYRDPDLTTLGDALLELWYEVDPDKRWEEIEYVIRDGRFEVNYTYPENVDQKEDSFVRRDRIVARHFGEKPIVYPEGDPDYPPFGDTADVYDY